MASTPLRRAVVGALTRRAQETIGPDAKALEYVEAWLAGGASLASLAPAVSQDLNRPISRGFVSFACQRLGPDARERLRSARLAGRQSRLSRQRAQMQGAQGDWGGS